MLVLAIIIGATTAVTAPSIHASELAGTWSVKSTASNDSTCKGAEPGAINANVWIVSASANGSIKIVVQGDTRFEKLEGTLEGDKKVIVLRGHDYGANVWFKLSQSDDKSRLIGTKRTIAERQATYYGGPCFADFSIDAKKQ